MNTLQISYQQSCNTAAILPDTDVVLTATVEDFIISLRDQEPLFNTLSIPEQGTDLDHGQLPAVIFSGTYTMRSATSLAEWNGILTLDIDAEKPLKHEQPIGYFSPIIDRAIEALREVNDTTTDIRFSPFAWCRSKSGKGVRVLYHFNTMYHVYADVAHYYRQLYYAVGNLVDAIFYNEGINALAVDYQAADISHPFAIVQDADAEILGITVDDLLLHKFLTSYTTQKKQGIAKNSGNITHTVDVLAFQQIGRAHV